MGVPFDPRQAAELVKAHQEDLVSKGGRSVISRRQFLPDVRRFGIGRFGLLLIRAGQGSLTAEQPPPTPFALPWRGRAARHLGARVVGLPPAARWYKRVTLAPRVAPVVQSGGRTVNQNCGRLNCKSAAAVRSQANRRLAPPSPRRNPRSSPFGAKGLGRSQRRDPVCRQRDGHEVGQQHRSWDGETDDEQRRRS